MSLHVFFGKIFLVAFSGLIDGHQGIVENCPKNGATDCYGMKEEGIEGIENVRYLVGPLTQFTKTQVDKGFLFNDINDFHSGEMGLIHCSLSEEKFNSVIVRQIEGTQWLLTIKADGSHLYTGKGLTLAKEVRTLYWRNFNTKYRTFNTWLSKVPSLDGQQYLGTKVAQAATYKALYSDGPKHNCEGFTLGEKTCKWLTGGFFTFI